MRDILNTAKEINANKLHEELEEALGDVFLGVSTGNSGITLHLAKDATKEQDTLAKAILEAHDATKLTAEQQGIRDSLGAWRESALAGKAPPDLKARIDGWRTLEDAQADLREWLPLMGAMVWYLMRGQDT
jgi:isopenicillin N synthase-like dioxygenase